MEGEVPVALMALEAMGGLGKTALALELVHRIRDRFPAGVFWLDGFGPEKTTAEHALRKLAAAHPSGRAAMDGGRAITSEDVRRWIEEAPGLGLVVADDIWHAAPLRELRAILPSHFRLFITTRRDDLVQDVAWKTYELLRLSPGDGESLLRKALEVPDATDAGAVEPLRKIVEDLGGHALGLRMAAGRLRREGGLNAAPRFIERLAKSPNPLMHLTLGRGESRDESVEKCFGLSYAALTDAQKVIFRATGAFAPAGDFDAEALMAVAGIEPSDDHARWSAEEDIMGLVPDLLNRDTATQRYSLHTLLGAYALALLQERGEEDEARTRHVHHYQERGDRYTGQYQPERLDPEFSQFLHAFAWLERHTPHRLHEFVFLVSPFMLLRYHRSELRRWLECALESATRADDRLGQANTLQSLGDLAERVGDPESARRYREKADEVDPRKNRGTAEGPQEA